MKEYRAVYAVLADPDRESEGLRYGPVRKDKEEAQKDRDPMSNETLARYIGYQERTVEPWRWVPILDNQHSAGWYS